MQNGILRALHDFAKEVGLTPFGNLSEPKLTACSLLNGDAMLNNAYSPCALFDKAYMYGTNSVKLAAGAAYNFDLDRVNAELFRHYADFDPERLYTDAMNAFARGVNYTGLHLTEELTVDSEVGDFVARVQTMLGSGSHVPGLVRQLSLVLGTGLPAHLPRARPGPRASRGNTGHWQPLRHATYMSRLLPSCLVSGPVWL